MNISTRRLSLATMATVVALAVLMVVSPVATAKPVAAVKLVEITKPTATGEWAMAARSATPNNAPRATLAGKDVVSAKKGVASAKRRLSPADTPSPRTGDFEIGGKDKLMQYKGSARGTVTPNSVKVISKEAFYRTGVVKAKVPAMVAEVEKRSSTYCHELVAVEFENVEVRPSRLVKIDESASGGTGVLKEIILSRSVTHLGKVAFYGGGIEKVALPVELVEIPERAFMKTGHLMNVTVPDNMTKIDFRALAITHSPRSLKVIGANEQISTGLPSKLKVLGKWAFWCLGIRQAVLPSGLEAIKEFAFNHSALEKPTLQEGLEPVGHGAFSFTNLTELTIPGSVVHVNGAVNGTRRIAKLRIGKDVGPDQSDNSSTRNGSLRTISVDEGNPGYVVTGRALSNKQLTKFIVVPQGPAGSSRSKVYNIPVSVMTIASYAFNNLAHEEVNPLSDLRTVENGTFSSSVLKRIVLPRGLETIGDSVLARAANLTDVGLGGTMTVGSYTSQKTSTLKAVNVRIDLNRLKEVGLDIFYDSGLIETSLLDSTTVVRYDALSGNERLLKVRLGSGLPTLEENVFHRTPQLREMTVVQGSQTFDAEDNILHDKRNGGLHPVRSAPGDQTPRRHAKDGVMMINNRIFVDDVKLEKLRLPDGLRSIGNRAFENAAAPGEARFPDNLEVVDGFSHTSSLHKAGLDIRITSIDHAFEGRCSGRIVACGAKGGKFVYSYDEGGENLTNGASRPKPVSTYFGERMAEVGHLAGLLPRVLISPGTLRELSIDSKSAGGQRKASAIFYVAAEPGSSAWKPVSEKMSAFGMDLTKQPKRYTPMSATAQPVTSSQGKLAITADVHGGVTEGVRQTRIVAVSSDGTTTPLSDWIEAKATGKGYQASVECNARATGGEARVEVRDHVELTLMADVSDGMTPSPEPSASQEPTTSSAATPIAGHAATSSPTASTGSAAPPSSSEPEASRAGRD